MIVLDTLICTLFETGHAPLRIRPMYSRILATLSLHPACTPYEMLFAGMWPGGTEPACAMSTLKVHVCNLRRFLDANGWPPLIWTVWGRGFALTEPIRSRSGETVQPVMIPAGMVQALCTLLWSHPDHAAAEAILFLIEAETEPFRPPD